MQYQQVTEALKQKMNMIILKGGKITSIRKICGFFFVVIRISSQVQSTVQKIKK